LKSYKNVILMVFMLAKAIKTTKALDGDSPESAVAHATGNRQRATSNLQLATGNRRCCCCLPANKVGFYSIVRLISSWKINRTLWSQWCSRHGSNLQLATSNKYCV